jgi:hypothetical protein
MGMSLPVAIGYKMYAYVFAHIQHSNIVLPAGPLKYIFPTPQFHRWHHARVFDANGKPVRSFCNFSMYPIWDLLFGTFYLPNKNPTAYGNARNVPMTYFAQVAYPFGWHDKVSKWEASIGERLGRSGWFMRIRAALAARHEPFENRLAKLSLVRAEPAESCAIVAAHTASEQKISN